MSNTLKVIILQNALRRIANDDYTKADERLTSTQPMMIWQLVALQALKETEL